MIELFLHCVNRSIDAGWMVLAVLVLRLLLKRAPKWLHVLLWGLVAVRLAVPFSPESSFSLLPSGNTISGTILSDMTPLIHSGIPVLDDAVNPLISQSFSPEIGASANPLQIWIPVVTLCWVFGMALLLLYTAISYGKLRRRIRTAVLQEEGIFCSERVVSPFVLGIISPNIYLPFHMDEKTKKSVIAHEKAHIRRKDHWWKPLGFLLLAIYWFQPLVWVAYILFCRDVELACDESVIQKMDTSQRADYSQALLQCSIRHSALAACPLAFGEVRVKERVKRVISYQKPTFWVVILAEIACAVLAIGFLTEPSSGGGIFDKIIETPQLTTTDVFTAYIGDAPTVSLIAQNLPYPEGYHYASIALQTRQEPYGLTVYLKNQGGEENADFRICAEKAFAGIGNLGVVSFVEDETGKVHAVATREDLSSTEK